MNNLDKQAVDMIEKLEQYEKHWHIFKLCFYLLIGSITILVILITYGKLINNSNANRKLLTGAVVHRCINN